MRLSLQMPTYGPFDLAIERARLAEDLGYDSLHCGHIASRDSFTSLAALATVTERIKLGTAVAPIYHRSPASMAQTAATVDEIAGGRFRLGLGVGHRVTMGDWHGQEIGSPTGEMREYVGLVRAILAGQEPPRGERWQTNFMFMNYGARPDIPIFQAALSPRMLRLAGEIADGVMLWVCHPGYIRDVVVPEVTTGRAKAGKSLDGFEIIPSVPTAVMGDREPVLDGVRNELHRYFSLPFYRAMFEKAGLSDAIAAYDAAAPDREAQKLALGEPVIGLLSAIGAGDEVRSALRRYIDAGSTSVAMSPVAGSDVEVTLREAASAIGDPAASPDPPRKPGLDR
jgi:alkanesulfonate monooxygenase SsuD/methylene tetrahydromethanopterin reductase-like flavin-dependent oxidoreductase (luciferase family)